MPNKPAYEELENRIIELEQSEMQRAKVEKVLRKSERHLSTLLGNLPGISYRCKIDEDWTMLYISEGSITLTGYHPSELIDNHSVSYNSLILPEDRQYVNEEIRKAIEQNRPFTIEYRILDRNKNEKWVWEKGIAIEEDRNGRLILEGFINDI